MKRIKIILNEDVYNLGEEGDVCTVAPGYARNYLIPKGFAVPFTRQNVAVFEEKKASIEKRKEEKRTAAFGDKERIESLMLEFEMPAGSSGKLFGSVTNQNIAERLMQQGVNIERKKIEVPGHTIKMTGEYSVTIKLYADESAELPVVVRAEGEKPESAEAAPKDKKEGKGKGRQAEPAGAEPVQAEEAGAELETQVSATEEEAADAETVPEATDRTGDTLESGSAESEDSEEREPEGESSEKPE